MDSNFYNFVYFRAAIASISAILLVLPPAAHAAYDPLGSGTAKLTLDRSFASFLKRNGIALTAKAPARRRGSSFLLPVAGGNLDPTIGKGEIATEGTLLLESARKQVPLRRIVIKTKPTPLIAKVGGSQLKLASSRKASSKRSGFGTSFQARALRLTAKLATRLDKKLRPRIPFSEGQSLGSLSASAQPRLTTILPQGRATLALDPAFVEKMDAHFVSINPIFPAEHQGSTFTFPIVGGGSLAPDGSEGELRTGGEMEFLQLGAGQVFWHEQWLEVAERLDTAEVDIEPAPAFPGKLGRIGVLQASPFQLSSDPLHRTISGQGIRLSLTAQSAQSFDEAFAEGKGDFAAGELVGVLGFVAQGQ